MKTKTVVILALVALAAVLLLQNSGLTQVRLFFWSVFTPLFLLLLAVFLIGFLVGFLVHGRDKKSKGPAPTAEKPAAHVPPQPPPARSQP